MVSAMHCWSVFFYLLLGVNALSTGNDAPEITQIESPQVQEIDNADLEDDTLPQPEFEDEENMTESSEVNLLEEHNMTDSFDESSDFWSDWDSTDFTDEDPSADLDFNSVNQVGEDLDRLGDFESKLSLIENKVHETVQMDDDNKNSMLQDGEKSTTSRRRRRRRRRRSSSTGSSTSTAEWKELQDAVKGVRAEFQGIRSAVKDKMGAILKALGENPPSGGASPRPSPTPSRPSPRPSPAPPPADTSGGAGYQYIWLVPTKTRGDSPVQLAEVKFKANGQIVKPASAENAPGGKSPGNEGPSKAIDGNTRTKWLGHNKNGLILKFGSKVTLNGFTYVTANDVPGRDIMQYELKGSNDKKAWKSIFKRTTDLPVPTTRFKEVPWLPLEPPKGEGESCSGDNVCETQLCKNGKCSVKSGEGSRCSRREECTTGMCEGGKCIKPKGKQLQERSSKKCIADTGGGIKYLACAKGEGSQLWSEGAGGAMQNAKTGKCIGAGRYVC